MSNSDRGKLGEFLREVINWDWYDFCMAERDNRFKGYEGTVFSLVRICSEAKLNAIQGAIERADGKLATPVKIEYPKVFLLYPEATTVAQLAEGERPAPTTSTALILADPAEQETDEKQPVNLATLSLRETVNEMADQPKQVVPLILQKKIEVEIAVKNESVMEGKAPLVKSVIAANLLHLANKNYDAIMEVFNQIDGKLVETIKILGEDIFITQYAMIAPYGSVKNHDGIYQIEAKAIANQWKDKLGGSKNGR